MFGKEGLQSDMSLLGMIGMLTILIVVMVSRCINMVNLSNHTLQYCVVTICQFSLYNGIKKYYVRRNK